MRIDLVSGIIIPPICQLTMQTDLHVRTTTADVDVDVDVKDPAPEYGE